MNLIDFINNTGNWVEVLSAPPYNITIKTKDGYFLLKYSQFESDFSIPLVNEARGCIIKYNGYKWVYVCRPFKRFYNEGEPYAAELDWDKVSFTEKIDGSLIKVWYDEEWHVSTMGNIDARDAAIQSMRYHNFYDMFKEAINTYFLYDCALYYQLDRDKTYLFELVSPENQIVLHYDKTELYYLTTIINETGKEFQSHWLKSIFKYPKTYFMTHDEIKKLCESEDGIEGWVAYDGVNRVKLKTQSYFKAHYLRNNNNITISTIIDAILNGEESEFLSYARDYTIKFNEIKYRYECTQVYVNYLKPQIEQLRDVPRAVAAARIKTFDKRFHDWAFQYLDTSIDFVDYLKKLNHKKAEVFFK